METREELKQVQYEERLKQNLKDESYRRLADMCWNAGLISREEYKKELLEKDELIDILMDNQSAIDDVYKED